MKCIKKQIVLKDGSQSFKVVRVGDKKAEGLVSTGTWSYAPKHEWKKSGRKYAIQEVIIMSEEQEKTDEFLAWMDQLADSVDEVSLQYRQGLIPMKEAENKVIMNVLSALTFKDIGQSISEVMKWNI